jgi:basic amino acid/polyamine antiporter, APA family
MANSETKLVRAIGRWSLAALMLNTMIGGSIFGLPSIIASRLGRLSPLAYLIAFAGVAVIAVCLAEVASRFHEAGGPYLYAREAFGPFAAIQMGWLTWLSRITASAAVANLFIAYLSEFAPSLQASFARACTIILLIAFLASTNYVGVSTGNRLSNFFTVTKLALLGAFVCSGLIALGLHPSIRATPPALHPTRSDWFEAVILLIYAYGGFEAALFPASEARDPRRDAPAALLIALGSVTLLYVGVQYVVIHTVANASATERPFVEAARSFAGPIGTLLVAAGAVVSCYGYLSANMLHTPRLTFAMAERGDFPAWFGAVHSRFRTPHMSIVAFAVALSLFSLIGNFRWNAVLSAVSRLFIYACVAAALPALRKKSPGRENFHLPLAPLFAALALLFTGVLATQMHRGNVLALLIVAALGAVNWVWARQRPLRQPVLETDDES